MTTGPLDLARFFKDQVPHFVDWYRQPSNNGTDYFLHQFAKNIPFIGGVLDADDNERRMGDYLSNRGLSWGDIRYNGSPFGRSLGQAAANSTASVMNLYRNEYKDLQRTREKNKRKRRYVRWY